MLQAPQEQQGQRGQLGLRVQLERLVLKAMPAPLVHRDLKANKEFKVSKAIPASYQADSFLNQHTIVVGYLGTIVTVVALHLIIT